MNEGMEGFCCGLSPLVLLDGKVTVNHLKKNVSDHFYQVMKNFSLMGLVSSKIRVPKFIEHYDGGTNSLTEPFD